MGELRDWDDVLNKQVKLGCKVVNTGAFSIGDYAIFWAILEKTIGKGKKVIKEKP